MINVQTSVWTKHSKQCGVCCTDVICIVLGHFRVKTLRSQQCDACMYGRCETACYRYRLLRVQTTAIQRQLQIYRKDPCGTEHNITNCEPLPQFKTHMGTVYAPPKGMQHTAGPERPAGTHAGACARTETYNNKRSFGTTGMRIPQTEENTRGGNTQLMRNMRGQHGSQTLHCFAHTAHTI